MRFIRYTPPNPAVVPQQAAGWRPAVDVVDAEKHYVLEVDLPGVDPNSVQVELEQGLLQIRGERQASHGEEAAYAYRERRAGKFERSFRVPEAVDADGITAKYDKGVLEIRVPKVERSRKIPIQ
jgi:HSP20 family protein